MPVTEPESRPSDGSGTYRGLIASCRTLLQLRRLAQELLETLDEIVLLALNAQIIAEKSNVNGAALSVIAIETQRLADTMGDTIRLIEQDARTIAQAITEAMIKVKASGCYERLGSRLAGTPHAARIQRAAGALLERSGALVERSRTLLDGIQMSGQSVQRQNKQVAGVMVSYRIEASRNGSNEAYFHHMAESLETFNGTINRIAKAMGQAVGTSQANLSPSLEVK